MERETIRQANEIVQKYEQENAKKAVSKAMAVMNGLEKPPTMEELVEIIRDANLWINWICFGDKELYNHYSFKLFQSEENGKISFFVARGEEIREIHPRYGKRKNT